ncbi:AzlD family protein [Halomonas sp. BC04]|uniref:AzlD family protein n=1 Tax=Halomonas sp. BC04 TaxID=1403540 RepID=UPI0003ED8563|nr:hypothetical protein Q427_04880 [Halomonas sp. BC04]
MTLPATLAGAISAIVIMALITYLTRAGGVFVMSRVPIGPRVERFINAMAGSVLVAVITPMAVYGDWAPEWHWSPPSLSCWPCRSPCRRSPPGSLPPPCGGCCSALGGRARESKCP